MGLTLESFRNGIQVASADVTGAGSKNGFLVYSEAEKGGLKLDLSPQTASQSDREFNIYVRSYEMVAHGRIVISMS